MSNEDEFDLANLDELDVAEEGSEFDLRDAELKMFARLYQFFLNSYAISFDSDSIQPQIDFLKSSKTLFTSFKRYVSHEEELYGRIEEYEDEVTRKLVNIQKGITVKVGYQFLDDVKECVEDMRHVGNFKMPQKTEVSEDQAWRKSV